MVGINKSLGQNSDIREQMKLIEKGVNQKEPRYVHRAVRCLQSLRKKANDAILRKVVSVYFPPSKMVMVHAMCTVCSTFFVGSSSRECLLNYLEEVNMELGRGFVTVSGN